MHCCNLNHKCGSDSGMLASRGAEAGMTDWWVCRYEEDLALARDVGSNAFRFSLEWSKVEPKRGQIDKSAILRYQQIIRCIRRSA